MITTCLRRPDGSLDAGLKPEDVRTALAADDGLVWVDLEGTDRSEGEPLLRDVFHFHPLTIDDCYNTLIDPPKADDYGDYLFIIIHATRYDSETQRLETAELDMYLGRNFVVTVHHQPMTAVRAVRLRAENHALVLDHGADYLMHALFDMVVDDLHPVVDALEDEAATLQERIIDRPERDALEQVLVLKRNAQRLKRSILPQRDLANRFSRGEYGELITSAMLMYYRDVYDHTVRVEEMVDNVRELADVALSSYLSSVNNRINEVMKALAIAAVVFLPLTLVAGIYGMNFENPVPAYDSDYGFWVVMGIMTAIGAALLAWFRWRRWI